MKKINYALLNNSLEYYTSKGFEYTEVPWYIPKKYIDITHKDNNNPFKINDQYLIGSAEQSFLYLYLNKKLPDGKYQSITPCFRNDEEDDLHQKYFIKNELFICGDVSYIMLYDIINEVLSFFNSYSKNKCKIIYIDDDKFDIYLNNIEIGSYCFRIFEDFKWICGTGLALPRFDIANNFNSGYHIDKINKGVYGEFSKIKEEFEELSDANNQNDKILELIEISDLIGAIEGYMQNKYNNITLKDIINFSNKTKHSFISGNRK